MVIVSVEECCASHNNWNNWCFVRFKVEQVVEINVLFYFFFGSATMVAAMRNYASLSR